MKMNQTFNRFTAILLALLLFTGNAGMLSAVSAEELPFDPGITSESMSEDDSAAGVSEEISGTGTSEESSAATDFPCQEPGDTTLEELNNLYSDDNNDPNQSYNQDPLTEGVSDPAYEESAFENPESAFGNQESAFGNHESAFGNQESAFGNQESAFFNDEPAFGNEAQPSVSEEAAFANEDGAIVSEDFILTGDTYGEALFQTEDAFSRAQDEGSDGSNDRNDSISDGRNNGDDDNKDVDGSKNSDNSRDSDKSNGSENIINGDENTDSGKNDDSAKGNDGNEGRGECSGVLINPLYAHLYDAAEIAAEEASYAFDEVAAAGLPQYKDASSAVALVRSCMKERDDSFGFTVSGSMSSYSSEKALMNALTKIAKDTFDDTFVHTGNPSEGDYILYQCGYITYNIQYIYNSSTFSADIVYTANYYTNASQEAAVTKKVNSVLAQLNLNGKNEYEKILAIYDYICRNVRYDNVHLNNPSYTLQFTAYAALINGTSVCQGYAVLLYRMLLESGIDCRVIDGIGAGGKHAWNIARIGSLYYNMDATWDSPASANGTLRHEWFLKGKGSALFPDHQAKYRALESAFISAHPLSLENYNPSQGAVVIPDRVRAIAVAAFKDLSGNARTQKSYSAPSTVMIYGRSSCSACTQMLEKAVETAKSANTGSRIIFLGIDDADDGIYDLANRYPGVTFSPASAANNSTMWELVSLCGLDTQSGTLYLPATFVFDRYGNTAYAFTGEETDKLAACMEYGSFDERLDLGDAGLTLLLEENIILYRGSAIKPEVRVLRKNGEIAPLTEGIDYKVTYSDNHAPGNATAKVSGMNGLSGQLTASFRILQPVASFSSTKVSLNKQKSKKIYLIVTNGDSIKLSLTNPIISANASTKNATLNKSTLKLTIPVTITAGKTAGTAKLVVTTGTGQKASCTITVNKTKTRSISVSKTSYSVKNGKTVNLNAKVSPANSDEPVKYKSANTAIATVSSKGVVKGKKKGITKVTISSGSVKKTVTIKVK